VTDDVPFFTIGHSNRSITTFAHLLAVSQVEIVVDVRTIPRSRANPQFNADVLPSALAQHQIGYQHLAELGGLRGRQRAAEPSPNAMWINTSFRNYADYALTEPFREGLQRLRRIGERRCAVMCAEAVWWRCHRRIIADYLIAAGEGVRHILGEGHVEPATLTPGAVVRPDAGIVYPASDGA
jgi:uncharacterized protein (DUF488 family)